MFMWYFWDFRPAPEELPQLSSLPAAKTETDSAQKEDGSIGVSASNDKPFNVTIQRYGLVCDGEVPETVVLNRDEIIDFEYANVTGVDNDANDEEEPPKLLCTGNDCITFNKIPHPVIPFRKVNAITSPKATPAASTP